jgi:hypothetical protein
MDFQIQNVLEKTKVKKFIVPAFLVVAGIVSILAIKNRSSGNVMSGVASSTGAGSQEEVQKNNDQMLGIVQGITSSINDLQSKVKDVETSSKDSIKNVETSVASIIADEKNYNTEQIKNLNTQLTTYQESNKTQLTNFFDTLTQKMNEKINNPVYSPSSSSYTPSIHTISSAPATTPAPTPAPAPAPAPAPVKTSTYVMTEADKTVYNTTINPALFINRKKV